jgi:alpha-galactosidase
VWAWHLTPNDTPFEKEFSQRAFDHVLATLSELVDDLGLDCIKWDMNRDLTHAFHQGKPVGHELTMAFYRMVEQLRQRFPALEIEVCASGGARADYGALQRGDRIWPSDNHDVSDKQVLHEAASLFFPPEVLGNHVGASPDHHSGRTFPLSQRALVAGMGHMGIEMDIENLTGAEADQLRHSIADYKANRAWLQASGMHILSGDSGSLRAVLRIARDESRARLYVYQRGTGEEAVNAPVLLTGLDAGAVYSVSHLETDPAVEGRDPIPALRTTGEMLHHLGLPLPLLQVDRWLIFDLVRVGDADCINLN